MYSFNNDKMTRTLRVCIICVFVCCLCVDLTEALDDESDATQSALSAVASLAAAWPQLHQGCSLKQLDLDSCTLSEILRLHILASGADCYHGNAKFRYQKQGGFTLMDDPCVELRLAEPALLKRLSSMAVYDLTPGQQLTRDTVMIESIGPVVDQ